uniref:Probable RNA-directed DNA polymerase from transposon X-element n=1 Tax=Zeugodacus cucurbitae TaxID=28588 RepID=A0A0A1WT85_ZEUCU
MKLTYLFNKSIHLTHFRSLWKVAEVVMVPKPGKDPHIISSYRPISLLPQLAKLFEKFIYQRLKSIINACKHSTIEQIYRIASKIDKSLEEGNVCSAVFLDVAQAFDKVWHEDLM